MTKPREIPVNEEDQSLFAGFKDWLRGWRQPVDEDDSMREALEELIETHNGSAESVMEEERILLANILHLRDLTVADVMVPHADIVAIEYAASFQEVIDTMTREGHSRLPVYRNTLDDIAGMVHIKDVVGAITRPGDFSVENIVRDVLFAAPAMRVQELLLEMRAGIHMVLVVDEFGGTDGLVTIEDLVEEIVGEIEDEHDTEEEPQFIARSDHAFDADARVEVETLEAVTGRLLSDTEREDVDTLGGLVFLLAGRVPTRGEIISHRSGAEFVVTEADSRRIRRLRVNLAKLNTNKG